MEEQTIFDQALEKCSPAECAAYLDQVCGGNHDLRARLERLLHAHFNPDPFFEVPPDDLAEMAASEMVEESVGSTIGPYRLLERIGEGGMGLVFMAEQQQPIHRIVALKIIKPGMDSCQVIGRFETERQTLALMDHPNIARILDSGTTRSGRPYFVMELVRGISVIDYCDRAGLTPRERLKLFITICQGVQHAHQHGIIHRDLKPANVLVTMHDDIAVPKVIDFGVSKATNRQLIEQTQFSNFAQLVGTPLYMSPEQAQMSGLDIDTRSDVYSLGILLYELLTGTTPFDRDRLREVGYDEMRRIIREEESPLMSNRVRTLAAERLSTVSQNRGVDTRRLGGMLRGELDWIVMKALEKSRQRRYDSASAFAADVQRYLNDQPVEAGPPSASYRLKKLVWRNMVALVTAFAVLGVIAVVFGIAASITYRQMRFAQKLADEMTQLAASEERLRIESNRMLAHSVFEQSYSKCSASDAAAGLLWLTRSLQLASDLGVTELERPIRRQIAGWSRYISPVRMTFSHSQAVTDVAFSPDGHSILTVCADHHARLWDVETGDLLCPPLQHVGMIHAAAFSPDGLKVATADADHTARLWDVRSGRQIGASLEHAGEVRALAFSLDGTILITGSDDRTARLWNTETLDAVGPPLQHQSAVLCVGISPDGTKAITGSFDGTAQLWNAATGQSLGVSFQHTAAVSAVTISPDGKVVLTAGLDRIARTWSAETGEPLGPPLSHEFPVELASFSPDGQFFVTVVDSKAAHLWETATGKPIGQPLKTPSRITSAHFSPNGKILLTAGLDWRIRIWDLATSQALGSALNCQTGVRSAVFSPDGQSILTGDDAGFARLWDISMIRPGKKTPLEGGGIDYVAVSPLGDVVLAVGFKTARLFDAENFRPLGPSVDYRKPELEGLIRTAAFSPDGRLIILVTADGNPRMWSAETMMPIGPALVHQGDVLAVAFTPDGNSLLTAGMDRCARLWDIKTQQPIGEPMLHTSVVCAVAISPDGKSLLTGCQDGYVRRWDLESREQLEPSLRHDGEVWAIDFSADGSTIVTGSYDHTARLWDARNGSPIGLPLDHGEFAVLEAQISPDGETISTVTGAYGAVHWNLAVRKPFGMPEVISTDAYTIRLTPDGKRVLVADQDKTIHSWDVPQSIEGDVEQVALWATVVTGMQLDEGDAVRPVDGSTWLTRHKKLRQLNFAP